MTRKRVVVKISATASAAATMTHNTTSILRSWHGYADSTTRVRADHIGRILGVVIVAELSSFCAVTAGNRMYDCLSRAHGRRHRSAVLSIMDCHKPGEV